MSLYERVKAQREQQGIEEKVSQVSLTRARREENTKKEEESKTPDSTSTRASDVWDVSGIQGLLGDPLRAIFTWTTENKRHFWGTHHPEIPTPEGGWVGRWEHDTPNWSYLAIRTDRLEALLSDQGHDPQVVIQGWHEQGYLFTGGARDKVTKTEYIVNEKVEVYAIHRKAFGGVERIDTLIATARERFGEQAAQYMRDHPEKWHRWLNEYTNFATWMNEECPGRGDLTYKLAARAVVAWIAHHDVGLIGNEEYRRGLAGLWEKLRQAPVTDPGFEYVICNKGRVHIARKEIIPNLCAYCGECEFKRRYLREKSR